MFAFFAVATEICSPEGQSRLFRLRGDGFREILLSGAKKEAAHGFAVPGDAGIEIASAVADTLDRGGKDAEKHATEGKAPDAEQGCETENQHAHEFEGTVGRVVFID